MSGVSCVVYRRKMPDRFVVAARFGRIHQEMISTNPLQPEKILVVVENPKKRIEMLAISVLSSTNNLLCESFTARKLVMKSDFITDCLDFTPSPPIDGPHSKNPLVRS